MKQFLKNWIEEWFDFLVLQSEIEARIRRGYHWL